MATERSVLHIPKRGYVRRKREIPPSVILHCCAGWGKSIFLAQLEREFPEKTAAFSLSGICRAEDMTDLLRRTAERLIGEKLSDSFGISDFIDIAEEMHLTVIADDLDGVYGNFESGVKNIVKRLVTSASEDGFRFAGACRRIPGFLLNVFPDGDCAELNANDLAFTNNETMRMIELYGGGKIPASEENAAALTKYTGGFPAAMAFILDRAAASGLEAAKDLGIDERLTRYIESTVLGDLAGETVSRLRRAAFLSECGCEMTADSETCELLGEKLLFSPLMHRQLVLGITDDERKKLFSGAVSGFIENNRLAEAIALFDKCGDTAEVEKILLERGEQLLENREFELIGYCAEIFDRYGAPKSPEAYGILAQYYHYKGDHQRAESCLNFADSMFGSDNVYSACRKLYNGLLRYDSDREKYTNNVIEAEKFLRENNIALPFLYSAEIELLGKIPNSGKGGGKLRVRRFGAFRITSSVNGYEIQWRTKKACEFMAYMLENDGRPISREQLLNVLWSIEIPNNAVAMFHNIIYNIRREFTAAGVENFIRYSGKCYSLDMSRIEDEDADIFNICEAFTGGSVSEVIKSRGVMRGYWGKYLENIDSSRANNLREYYDKCFVDISLVLAEHYHDTGDLASELEILGNAAELDPYSEKIVRDILYCYTAQGRPNKAKEKYDSFCEFIGNELGIAPGKWLRGEFLSCFNIGIEE